MNNFTLVVNAGRSGSTFLATILTEALNDKCYVCHEDIPVQITRPRVHNRAYRADQIEAALADKPLREKIRFWQDELTRRPVVETGWTAYHLCPVLLHVFKSQFRYVILHRDPIGFAMSRANMGNYHPASFYDDSHEVSPFDPRSIAVPCFREEWARMNHFEKCMFWWYVVYSEACEFRTREPDVPTLEIKASDLFSLEALPRLFHFFGFTSISKASFTPPRNEVARFARETFPLGDEWRSYARQRAILDFAETLGYHFDEQTIEQQAKKYSLPDGFGARFRYWSRYWKARRLVKSFFYRMRQK